MSINYIGVREVTRLKKGMTKEIRVRSRVFADVNKDDGLPPELKSRSVKRHLLSRSPSENKPMAPIR